MDTKAVLSQLEPCPFCGSEARRSEGGTGEGKYFGTGCAGSPKCPASLHGLFHRTQDQADDAWNRRASLRAALADGEAEPVAWTLQSELDRRETTCRAHLWFNDPVNSAWTPLYTHPSPAALRAAVIEECADECERMMMYPGGRCEAPAHNNVWEAAAAIRALKTKEQP